MGDFVYYWRDKMSNNVLSGQKTLLIPLSPVYRGYYLSLLEMEDVLTIGIPSPLTELSKGWIIKTKEGRGTRSVGIITFTPITNISVMLQMVIDPIFARNLEDEIKKRYTYVEDGLVTAIEYVVNMESVYHIETLLFRDDRISNSLLSKIGFERAGVLNKVVMIDDEIKDMIILELVKEVEEPIKIEITEQKPELINVGGAV